MSYCTLPLLSAAKLARDSPEGAELTKHEGIAMSEGVSRRKVDGRETEGCE